jgi:uncharacterized protein YcbK (DUF882 family)
MAMTSVLVASCSTGDPTFDLSNPSLAGAEVGAAVADNTALADTPATGDATESDDPNDYVMSDGSPVKLPDTMASVPADKPTNPFTDATAPAGTPAPQANASGETQSTAQAAQAAASDANAQTAAAAVEAKPSADQLPEQAVTAEGETVPVPAEKNEVYVTATEPAQPLAVAPTPRKRSFFAALFAGPDADASASAERPKPLITQEPKPLIAQEAKPKALVDIAPTDEGKTDEDQPVKTSSLSAEEMANLDPLPGVRKTALFEIKRKSGIDDDSDIDVHEEEDFGPVQVATAGGLARMSPNGLITQTENVDVACLKPSLVRVLKTVEGHYGKKLVVTSGYRSPEHNRRARGAKNSLHMFCAAADIQVPGIGKWELAAYFRTMPGRGGVGTYCHTESVHIDIGPERDWNWRCRRRR